ncbi:MAG: A/G-specific adenine glycosylase [Chloroflexota bacterium]
MTADSATAVRPLPVPPTAMQAAVLEWYAEHGRALPFRRARNAYEILVSELMSHQTQAARAGEAWADFLVRFPSFEALAAAAPAEVLRAWAGLGYDRRAIYLWRTATIVVAELGGRLPDDPEELERLPGIGPYTARAVAALAFGRPVGAVDTNVRRVLGRVAGGGSALSTRSIQELADELVPRGEAGTWTHALMDIGARLCRPNRPDCPACPLRSWCRFAGSAEPIPGRRAPRRDVQHPFPTTRRWLRGRILARLRSAPDGTWVRLPVPIGQHDGEAIAVALAAMARDGVVEVDVEGETEVAAGHGRASPPLARLPLVG